MPDEAADKKKIIVIDDDRAFLAEFTDMLKSAGYEVTALTDCATILDIAPRLKPDLIVLDLKLKSMSGFEGASALRYFPSTSCIPVIAMSAFYTLREHDFLANFCGIKRFLKKPFSSSEAFGQIEDVLKERRAQLNVKGDIFEDHEEDTGSG